MYPALIWIAGILLAIYLYFRQVYTYFSRRGVKHFTPIPPFGNITKIIFKMEHFIEANERDYTCFPEERFVGRFEFTSRQLVIRDLDLIKKIAVRDFEQFHDRRILLDTDSNPLLGKILFLMRGQKWRDMRSSLSPVFTSSKLRMMVPFIVEAGEQMIKALRKMNQNSNLGYIDVDVKDMTTRFSNDAITSSAFGLKVDSFMEVDNKYYTKAKKLSTIKIKEFLISLGYILVPKLMKVLKMPIYSDSSNNFLRHMVMSTMQDREERNSTRPDMIHLLMEAKKRIEWSDDDLAAQTIPFVVGGFETVSSAISFLLHELALNPEVQEKLYQEIMENETKNEGKVDYTSLQQMTYMDMVVSESLRLWPPVASLDRVCNKDYNCGKPNDKAKEDFILRKDDSVAIPILGIHRDPQYFPDPLKFDPERFSDENKHKIHPFTYMPFGLGPRHCIGTRFALCEMKVMTYQLLREMKLSAAAKTCIPATLSHETVFMRLKGGHWVRMTPRN